MSIQQDNKNIKRQQSVIAALHISKTFDVAQEISRRIAFLKERLKCSQRNMLVLGISGGIDSAVAGRLCQLAVMELRHEGIEARFIAMRLPYGVQQDEHDAREACRFIEPDEIITVNIKPASDAMLEALCRDQPLFDTAHQQDFIRGNIKARQRMIAQYAIAGVRNGLVVGTDHAAEALMGFFTKFGDGACDITPLTGLIKRRIRAIGAHLLASERLINKCPTADLECLAPLKPDEDVFGLSYDEIDDFLEGRVMSDVVYTQILRIYDATEHKRQLPVAISAC